MKKLTLVACLALATFFLLIFATSCNSSQPGVSASTVDAATVATLKAIAGPPPASLDQYYPPKAQGPVWLIDMFNMAGPFGSIGGSLQGQDMPGVKASFMAFQTQITKMSTMVPEWTSRFKLDTVTALGKAIDGGNPAQIGPAMAAVGQICADCHLLYQVKVQEKYHWPDFDTVKLTDPVSGKQLGWIDYKTAMAGSYEGMLGALQAGKADQARQLFQAFSSQFNTLGAEGCKQCHSDPVTQQEIPRKYYVDADSKALLAQIGTALAANPPDATAVANLAGAFANGVCVNCHFVHFPAQNAKDIWNTYQNILK